MNNNHREPNTAFRWRRDATGYDLSADGKMIVRRGGALIDYEPPADLHRTFLNLFPRAFFLGKTPITNAKWKAKGSKPDASGLVPIFSLEDLWGPPLPRGFLAEPALLKFVRDYGFLGSDRWGADVEQESVEYLEKVWRDIFGIQWIGEMKAKDGNSILMGDTGKFSGPLLRAYFEADKSGRTLVRYRPESLSAWLWLRVFDDLSSGVKWDGLPCLYCHKPIGRGPGGYRSHAKFCSDNHKKAFSRLSETEQSERLAKAKELQRNRREGGT